MADAEVHTDHANAHLHWVDVTEGNRLGPEFAKSRMGPA